MRRLLWLLLPLALYFAYGTYTSNFYQEMVRARQQVTAQNNSELDLALVYSDTTSDGFLTGAEIALEETTANDKKINLQTMVVSDDSSTLASLSAKLRRNLNLSVLVCDVPTRQESSLAVLSETYGVGALLVNARSPFVSSKGFRYVNLVEPGFRTFCDGVLAQLPIVCEKEPGERVQFGVFFDRNEVDSDALVNTLVESTARFNENYTVVERLRKAVKSGLLKEQDSLSVVSEMFFLSSHIADDRPALNGLLRDFMIKRPESTVQDALEAANRMTNPLHSQFTQSILSGDVDPAVLTRVVKKGPELDCVILVGEVRRLKPVIRVLRSLIQDKPIIVMDYQPAGWIEANYGTLATNMYLVTSVDAGADTPRMEAFRSKFEQLARSRGREVTQVDEAAVLAYESVTMLREVTAAHDTTIPIEIMTLLQQYGANWPGLTTDKVGFDSSGDGVGREVFLITLDNGQYRYVRKDDTL